MPMFPDAWMGELLSKVDMVSLVSSYVQLRPKGGRLWGCCPFHNEKTPSFSVVPEKQFYYCFGCHKGGGAVQFVMETERLGFVDAVKWLAQRAGMELPGEVDDEALRRERAVKERIYSANQKAARYYYDMLMSPRGEAARQYLKKRGVDARSAKRFGLGYAPPGWTNLTEHLTSMDYTQSELIQAGLALKGKKDGGCYDAFRDRVIFPIIDVSGRVLGFGARTMGDDTPKYINTGDTPVYNKRNHLYGMNLLKGKNIAELVMVEGYMDVIRLVGNGIENTVAGLGTALTQNQARLMKRFVSTVYLCYDGDSAGQNAALRGLDILAKEGLEVRVIVIPDGLDPDDYVKRKGREAFLELEQKAIPRNGFKLQTIASRYDLEDANAREAFAREACAFAGTLEPVEKERYAPYIARRSGLSLDTVKAQCDLVHTEETNSVTKYRNTNARESGKNDGPDKLEQLILACMLHSKEGAIAIVSALTDAGEDMPESIEAFAGELLSAYMESDTPEIALLLAGQAPETADVISSAQMLSAGIQDAGETARECVNNMRRERLHSRLRELSRIRPEDGDEEFREALMEIKTLQTRLKALEKTDR